MDGAVPPADFGALSLLPPLAAILLAVLSRQVYLSLAAGLWLGYTMLGGWNPLAGAAATIEGCIAVLGDPGDARVIAFTLVIGALIAVLEKGGGVAGFIAWIERAALVRGARGAQLLAYLTGLVVFIESNITILVAGALARPLCDRHGVSREKLAYIIDSTSAPVCILIPLNAWGAYTLGLLDSAGIADPLPVFIASIACNFYALGAVLLTGLAILLPLDIGPMRRAEQRTRGGELLWPEAHPVVDPGLFAAEREAGRTGRARNMLLPVGVLVAMVPFGLWISGDGNLLAGSGSTSVLWAVTAALATAWLLCLVERSAGPDELSTISLQGMAALLGLSLILLFALALGDLTRALGTAAFVASLIGDGVPAGAFLVVAFLASASIGFSIGSSWGTFAIMVPIVVPVAPELGLSHAAALAAVLSGGVFGDHASPISDTTIVASMAAATDHIDHVRTQLPYALLAGAVATLGFTLLGLAA